MTGVIKVRSVQFSPDEWLAGTMMLTAVEKASYITICALIYSRGGPIDDDDRWLARNIGVDVRTWKAARRRLLALGKIQRIEPDKRSPNGVPACGQLTNKRCEKELLRAVRRTISSRSAADRSVIVRRSRRLL